VRWHGRGGQGVVIVSRLLAYSALLEGKFVQSFPEFGPERGGAPILGFTRISDEPIDVHSQIYNPDIVVVLDPTLLKTVNFTEGLTDSGKVILNSDKQAEELRKDFRIENASLYVVDARRIALDILGRPIYNTAMLGALIKAAPLSSLDSISKALCQHFSKPMAEANMKAVRRAHEEVGTR